MSTDDGAEHVRLLTRADDGGTAESANDAIRESYEEGILQNVSVMAPTPALEHAADRLAGVEGLCVGVHVTLSSEWVDPTWGPVLGAEEVPSLVTDGGRFYRSPEALFETDPDREEVLAEVSAQVDRIRDVGFDPDYADTHMLIEPASEWFADAFDDLCEREDLINWWGVSPLPGSEGIGSGPEWLLDHLDGVDPGTYLVVGHPAYDDDEMAEFWLPDGEPGRIATERDAQRRMFTDDRVLEYVEEHGVEPIRYDER
ncbi:hypothetical protein L593_00615 [Salinarchaeum sp. Harcht-Bsk1]|uniref:carbohydrate deacetylase n=1 Tax=Salinarchaeum sp. Harcht-Bsk1 TaxID=1333523 RepID=UPI0003424850|nr:ChbG/HpnK family deacetylase [Salinarchaeum sp. Harcht-Bsk1]AGN00078.1 hypothetical protein L593_00615 [Salinarchaeum sp. Harcht-Bsk1]